MIDIPLAEYYFKTGLVPRLPTALLSVAIGVTGVLSCFAGLILDMVTTTRREKIKRLAHLAIAQMPRDEP